MTRQFQSACPVCGKYAAGWSEERDIITTPVAGSHQAIMRHGRVTRENECPDGHRWYADHPVAEVEAAPVEYAEAVEGGNVEWLEDELAEVAA